MSTLRIEMLDDGNAVEVLTISGGREEIAAVLTERGQDAHVTVEAPTSVVLREIPLNAAARFVALPAASTDPQPELPA